MRIVHFGAGNIGRGAIPEIFKTIYSHITFVDPNEELVEKINNISTYKIINNGELLIKNYDALCFEQEDEIISAIQKSDLITTSCGINNLGSVAKILNNIKYANKKITVIAFENNVRPSTHLKSFIKNKDNFIFVDCTIDRIIPKQTINKDDINVKTEAYLSIVVEKQNELNLNWFKNCLVVDDLDIYISLKLYGVNGLHFIIAVLGYQSNIEYIDEIIQNKKIMTNINIYIKFLTNFLVDQLKFDKEYVDNYLKTNLTRFFSTDIKDECTRIARNSKLKLSYNNRVIPIFDYCFKSEKYGKLEKDEMKSILMTLISYKNDNDIDSLEMQKIIKNNNVNDAIRLITGLSI